MLVPICVQYIFIILLLRHKYSATLQHRRNLCQTLLLTARRPSRSNVCTPVPAPANVDPSISPPYHQLSIRSIRLIQPVANHPEHKGQFLLANPRPVPIRFSRYGPADTIHPIIHTIQPILSRIYDQSNTLWLIQSSQIVLD